MSTIFFRQTAPVVYQQEKSTFAGSWASTETVSLTIGNTTVTVTATQAMTYDEMAAALMAAVNGSSITSLGETRDTDGSQSGELGQVEASYVSPTFYVTGRSQRPFTGSIAYAAAAGSASSLTNVRSASGPEHLIAANCSTGALPDNGDTFVIDDLPHPLRYGLNALTSKYLAALHIRASAENQIGLPVLNTEYATPFRENLTSYLQLSYVTLAVIGEGGGRGQNLCKIQCQSGTTASAFFVHTTDAPILDNMGALQIKGTFTGTTLDIMGGEVELAPEEGDAATILNAIVTGGSLVVQRGVSLSAGGKVELSNSAYLELWAACQLLVLNDPSVQVLHGEGTITTLNGIGGGTVKQLAGDIATLTLGSGCRVLCKDATDDFTITTINLKGKGWELDDPNARSTITNAIDTTDFKIEDGRLALGRGRTITIA